MTSGITLFTRGGGPPQSFFSSSSPSSSSSHTSASAASKHTLAGAWASFFPPTSTRPCCARCSLRRIEFVLLLENRMCSLTTWCSSRRISATSLGRKHSVYLQNKWGKKKSALGLHCGGAPGSSVRVWLCVCVCA